MCYLFSSPYLLVFGDDRVRGTREQMILQVELVRLSRGVGESLGVLYCFDLKYLVNSYERLYYFVQLYKLWIVVLIELIKCLQFPTSLGNGVLLIVA